MRLNHFLTLGKIVIAVSILLLTPIKGLAQSAVDLVVHYVEVTRAEDGTSYGVNVYFSVLDDSANPVRDLTEQALTVAEDGQKVEVQRLGTITDQPLNLVLVMDTSGSMLGASITDAKAATINFVLGLMKPNDQASIMTFDNNFKTQVNFTSDQKTITDGINRIDVINETGSCLYDSAYAAVDAVSTFSSGSRAVILLTDGRDETANHAICSARTAEEVIQLASNGEKRTPIYTLGLGSGSDTESLRNLSKRTGGLYFYASNSSKLTNVLQTLSDRLRLQYIVTYKSTSLPGPHIVTLSMNQTGVEVKDSRNFQLSALPVHIAFTTPLEGETVGNLLKIAVSLTSQGDTVIERVAFEVNGVEVDSDETKPYEIELDARQYPIGAMAVSAIAYGANNTELARSSPVHLTHAEHVGELLVTPAEVQSASVPAGPVENSSSMVVTAVILSGLSIVAIAVLLFFLVRQQKQAGVRTLENDVDDNTQPPMMSIPVYHKVDEDRKESSSEFDSGGLGALTVEASDDSSLLGHRFEITTSLITLGRSADNDINFPNDKPVSRHHAEIYQIGDKLYLREVETTDDSGTAKPPKYGTFLNQTPMGPDPALLKTGDEIQLGKRVRLKFESYARDVDADMLTYDDLTGTEDVDQTQAQ
ncbi:MAG TPA: VWA domain-containing protein [Anaerolineales bacterium]|nr:VWA domain-containing protein [Anaerolineales bacterium]